MDNEVPVSFSNGVGFASPKERQRTERTLTGMVYCNTFCGRPFALVVDHA